MGGEMVRFATGAIAALLLLLAGAVAMATPSAGPMDRGTAGDPLFAQQRGSSPPVYRPPPPVYRPPPPVSRPSPPPATRPQPAPAPTYRQPPPVNRQPPRTAPATRPYQPPPIGRPSVAPQQRPGFARPPAFARPATAPTNQRATSATAANQRPATRSMPLRVSPAAQQAAAIRSYRQASAFVVSPRPARPTALSVRPVSPQQTGPRVAGLSKAIVISTTRPGSLASRPSKGGSACAVELVPPGDRTPVRHLMSLPPASMQRTSLGALNDDVLSVSKWPSQAINLAKLQSDSWQPFSRVTSQAPEGHYQVASLGSGYLYDATHANDNARHSRLDLGTGGSFWSESLIGRHHERHSTDGALLIADAGCGRPSFQQNAKLFDFGARAERIDKGQRGHANSMHGAQTTLDQQRLRARYGIPPDPKQPKYPTSASRFISKALEAAAYKMARRELRKYPSKSGVIVFEVNMGRLIGEGYLLGGKEYRSTNYIFVKFVNGNLRTMYPDIVKYPN